MALNGQRIVDAMKRLLPSDGSSTDDTMIEEHFAVDTKESGWYKLAVGEDIDMGIFSPRTTILVTEVKAELAASVASNATSFWQFQLLYDDDAGGSDTPITSTFTGSVTAITANVPVSIPLSTTGGVQVPAGKRVLMKITGNDTVAANTVNFRVAFKKLPG